MKTIRQPRMLKKIIFLLFMIAVGLGGFFYWNFTHAECIPVRGYWFEPSDYSDIQKILAAMKNLADYAPDDYRKMCALTTRIELADFETPGLLVPKNAWGVYQYNRQNRSSPGYIMIDRDTPEVSAATLESVLVHETCHANQAAENREFDETECHDRGHAYLLSRPQPPLQERSAELIKNTGYERSVYCRAASTSGKDSSPYQVSGTCVFINNQTTPAKVCAEVYLTYAGEKIKQKQVCAELAALNYEEVKFELSDTAKRRAPQDTDPLKQYLPDWPYEFGFSSPDRLRN